mmetsp:Transcript_23149/g.30234  ORF Transcript_23149/g.30234 Transcript_23149/m.30234 type:complete len:93 (+) Transcript_23149:166-444(+)
MMLFVEYIEGKSIIAVSNDSHKETVIDSGSTKHVVKCRDYFTSFKPRHNKSIQIEDGSSIKTLGQGYAQIPELGRCSIENALCVPQMSKNLL